MKQLNGSSTTFLNYLVKCLAISTAIQLCAVAQEEKVVNVNNDQQPVNVDGEALEEEIVDGELQYLDNELKKQGNQIKLNAKKTQKYKKLQTTTEKLSDTTEKYVEEKKTSEKSIKEYNQKIKCLLDESGTDPECDEYRTEEKTEPKVAPIVQENVIQDQTPIQQAAPQQPQQPLIIQNIMPEQKTTEVEKEEIQVTSPEVIPLSIGNTIEKDLEVTEKIELQANEKLKIYPYLGMTTFDGTGVSGNQSNILMGIRFESKPYAGRFAMGAGISYTQLTGRDIVNNNFYNTWSFGFSQLQGPEYEVTSTAVDLYGKVFLIKDSSFMPYVLAGFGYNMMNIQYNDYNGNYVNVYSGNAPSGVSRNTVTGKVGGGVDYAFNNSIGANLELNYSRNLTSLNNQTSPNMQGFAGDYDVNNLANNFANANLFSVQAGLLVFF